MRERNGSIPLTLNWQKLPLGRANAHHERSSKRNQEQSTGDPAFSRDRLAPPRRDPVCVGGDNPAADSPYGAGLVGVFSLACAAAAVAIDAWTARWLRRVDERLDLLPFEALKRVQAELLSRAVAVVTAYSFPYIALAFAPTPGPLVALLFAAGAIVIMTSQHVMTKTMIFYTLPPMAIALFASAGVVGQDFGSAVGIEVLAVLTIVNAIVMARAGAKAFEDTVSALLKAERAAEELELRVAERTSELLEAMRTAEAASRAKSLFLANMSHELRTPLNAVIGYSEIIGEDLASNDVSECAHHIARVRASALHLLGLISDILDLAKVEAEKVVLRPEEVDVSALAREVLDIVAPAAAENGTSCDLLVEPGAESLYADGFRFRQCLMNLVSNAVKFTQEGRVIVHARRCIWNEISALALEVRDTGIGIEADMLPYLFQPFVQADASITRSYGGTGLGLSITRRYARLMGGDVAAESTPGKGSRFVLTLPLRAEEAIDARAAAA